MRIEHELVTPKRAAELLMLNYEGQRSLRRTTTWRYASDMASGSWRETGDTIKVSHAGKVIDGQHRLQALIQADVSIWFWIAYDVPVESYDVLDQGLKRTLSDVLSARGVTHSSLTAAAVGTLDTYRRNRVVESSGRIGTISELLVLWETNREVENFTTIAAGIAKTLRFPGSVMAAMLYLFSLTKTEDVEKFGQDIVTGDGIRVGEPAFAVRRMLLERMATSGGRRYAVSHYSACTVRAWNALARGESAHSLKGRINGKFPEIFDPHNLLEDWATTMAVS